MSATKFVVTDTRRMTAGVPTPLSSKSNSANKARLLEALNNGRQQQQVLEQLPSGPRQDLDMHSQRLAAEKYHQAVLHEWAQRHAPANMTCSQQIFSLKIIITEAERYQVERGYSYLKNAVLVRAAESLGPACPPNFLEVAKPSTIVINDVDLIVSLPANVLPAGVSANQFAASSILALPMWNPPKNPASAKKHIFNTKVPTPPTRSPVEKSMRTSPKTGRRA